MLLFGERRDSDQIPNRSMQAPATGMILFEEKAKARWQPDNTTPDLAPWKWDLPRDEKAAGPLPVPATQPELSRTVPGTVWHASKSQTHDMAAPPPSQ
jgi:hypothetical protein